MGVALKLLLDQAVADVIASTRTAGRSARVALFLQMWYREGQTVVAVAKTLGLHRTHVASAVQRPALELVARRFLELAEQVDPPRLEFMRESVSSADFSLISARTRAKVAI